MDTQTVVDGCSSGHIACQNCATSKTWNYCVWKDFWWAYKFLWLKHSCAFMIPPIASLNFGTVSSW